MILPLRYSSYQFNVNNRIFERLYGDLNISPILSVKVLVNEWILIIFFTEFLSQSTLPLNNTSSSGNGDDYSTVVKTSTTTLPSFSRTHRRGTSTNIFATSRYTNHIYPTNDYGCAITPQLTDASANSSNIVGSTRRTWVTAEEYDNQILDGNRACLTIGRSNTSSLNATTALSASK